MLTLLLALPLSGAWISAPDYAIYTDLKSPDPVVLTKKISSEGFDSETCSLWTREADTGKLSALAPKAKRELPGVSGEILSDWTGTDFLTRSQDGKSVERRDRDGKVLETVGASWAGEAVRVVSTPDGKRWALLSRAEHLVLLHLDEKYGTRKETPIAKSTDFWGTAKILVDTKGRKLWVGYAATRPGLIYSPHVARLDFEGKVEAVYQWKEKGLFFDACLDEEFSILASRDIPSSPYTLPVYSTLESLASDGEIKTRYEAETNYFIDALACQTDRVLMVQRSIFGSDGSYLVNWSRVPGASTQRLLRLPGPARRLYACSGFSEGISVE